ncbi:MAG: DUF11 domain-containing protein [Pirellulales bacterium]|nr:DUF11 domain-containing protein [Pirellulales bacterium]
MVGNTRVVAKLIVASSLLATTGGSAYYYTTHGFVLPQFLQNLRGTADTKQAATSNELDAVASAWAGPAESKTADPELSSPIARSANGKPAVATATLGSRATGGARALANNHEDDRYAVVRQQKDEVAESNAAQPSGAAATSTKPEMADAAVVQASVPTSLQVPSADGEPVAVVSHEDVAVSPQANQEPGDTGAARPIAGSAPEPTLARGQEPRDDSALPSADQAAELNAAFAATGDNGAAAGGRLAEPRPLPSSVGETAMVGQATDSQRAAQQGGIAPMGDRYGNASAGSGAAAPSAEGALSNPFTKPPSTAASGGVGAIEPLPPAPADLGDSLRAAQQPSVGLRPLEPASTASSVNRDTPLRSPGQLPRQAPMNAYDRSQPAAPRTAVPTDASALPTHTSNDITPLAAEAGSGKPGEKALEGPQQPTLVIQKFAPGEIQVGKPAKFVVQVRNVGAHAADNVTIRDEVPQGTTLVSTSPSAASEGGTLVWQLGKLSPGEDRTVEMQLMPTAEGELGSVATVSYSAQASVKTKCTMPQLAVRMSTSGEVMIGQQQHIKIEIRNPGTGDATGVMLFENVPPNVKHVAGPALEFEIGTLRPGETRELDLVLTAEKAGKVVNTLTAKADGNLSVQQQVEFEVIAPALAVSLEGPERRYLERPATYEVSVNNPGTAPAHDVQIVTKLPKGMRFVRANNMGEYDPATHAVYWSLAELPKGERGSVELVAMPTETGPQTLQVDGRAQQGLSDHTQREVVVEGLAAIMFEVRDLEDPIEVGGETGYEIRVVNQGTKAAANVQVSVDLPAGLKVLSAEGETSHRIQPGKLVYEPLGQLAPKADTVFRFRVQGLQPGDQRINVQVNTDDLGQPIRREESTRVFGDQ